MRIRLPLGTALGLAAAAALADPPREAPAQLDAYGYAVAAAAPACPYQPVDMTSAPALALSAAEGAADASDEGAAVLDLAAPFELYGGAVPRLMVSSNGYLAAAAGAEADDGGDFSNDCPLPAAPDHVGASSARIYAYHDDLAGPAGAVRSSYFTTCPRPAASGAAEACTVVAWTGWGRVGGAGALSFQAVLYHTSFEIALQYLALDASAGGSASIGAQDATATSAAVWSCNGSRALAAGSAVCLFDPRYPPGSGGVVDRLFRDGFDGAP